MTTPRKRVLIHGLFLRGYVMRPMARHFRARGHDVLILDYPTRSQTLAQSAAAWAPRIREFAQGQPIDCVGHSLGGLLIRHLRLHFPEQIRRAATLGTPHQNSAAALYFRRFRRGKLIAQSWPQALDGQAPEWDARIPLLSLAGTRSKGVGSSFGLFRGEPSDGTVAVAETRLPQAAAYCELPYGHTRLIFARRVMDVLDAWFDDSDREQPPWVWNADNGYNGK